jgi:hypothetical protein
MVVLRTSLAAAACVVALVCVVMAAAPVAALPAMQDQSNPNHIASANVNVDASIFAFAHSFSQPLKTARPEPIRFWVPGGDAKYHVDAVQLTPVCFFCSAVSIYQSLSLYRFICISISSFIVVNHCFVTQTVLHVDAVHVTPVGVGVGIGVARSLWSFLLASLINLHLISAHRQSYRFSVEHNEIIIRRVNHNHK